MKEGRSVMKWQTGCQTPYGSETLTHRLMYWAHGRGGEMERDGWHGDRMGGKRVGAGGFGVFPLEISRAHCDCSTKQWKYSATMALN